MHCPVALPQWIRPSAVPSQIGPEIHATPQDLSFLPLSGSGSRRDDFQRYAQALAAMAPESPHMATRSPGSRMNPNVRAPGESRCVAL